MHGRLVVIALVVGILVPTSSALAALPAEHAARPVSSGNIGVRLVDVPIDSRDDPLARSYIVGQFAPETTIHRTVEITNDTRSEALVSVYPAAASFIRGRFAFASGHTANELSSWTSVSEAVLRVPARTKSLETVTIRVPADASSGEHYAVIWAEVSAPAPATGGVTLVNRVGIRVYLSVGPGGGLPSSFTVGALTAERSAAGKPLVVTQVHNTGPRTLDISGDLTLSDGPGGLRAGPFPVRLETALAPGGTRRIEVQLDKRLPNGPWQAQIQLTSGLIERNVGGTITFPPITGPVSPAPPDNRDPIVAVISLLGLLALAALAVLLFRRARRGPGVGPAATT
jgi:hypothetical protein